LIGKAKELLFNINIDTDNLNKLAKFNNNASLNYSYSKENV